MSYKEIWSLFVEMSEPELPTVFYLYTGRKLNKTRAVGNLRERKRKTLKNFIYFNWGLITLHIIVVFAIH